MHKRFVSIYFSASLACMIPFPGRFAYGLILAVELFVLVFGATLFRAAIEKLEFVHSGNLFFMVFVIFLTMLFRQILAALLPVAALSAGFALYVPAISAFTAGFFSESEKESGKSILKRNVFYTAIFCAFVLVFFLLRDLVGFGTITYITAHGIAEKVLFDSERVAFASFFATIPGVLLSLALIAVVRAFIASKSMREKKKEMNRD